MYNKSIVFFMLLGLILVGCDDNDPTGPRNDFNEEENYINLLDNGSFENGTANWQLDSILDSAWWDVTCTKAADGSCSAEVHQISPASEFYQVMLKQTGFPLVKDTWYIVGFWAKAAEPRPLIVMVMNDNSPWENFGFFREVNVGSAWSYYEYTFESTVSADAGTRLAFALGTNEATVWLDGVSLVKPEATTSRIHGTLRSL